jgi:hypothetical protein
VEKAMKGRSIVGGETIESRGRRTMNVEVEARPDNVRVLASAAFSALVAAGFESWEATRASIVVEEMCLDAVERCTASPDTEQTISLAAYTTGLGVTFEVRDRGLPLSSDRARVRRARELVHLGFAEGLSVFDVTPQGPLTKVVTRLPAQRLASRLALEEEVVPPRVPLAPEDAVVELRRMEPADAVKYARLVYRCWGYDYDPHAFEPEELARQLEQGDRVAGIALDADGEIVGHMSFRRIRPGSKVVEGHAAMVDPRYRMHGLLKRLGTVARPTDVQGPVLGMLGEPVMIHTATQHLLHERHGHDVGVLLEVSRHANAEGFAEQSGRMSLLCGFIALGALPQRVVHPPPYVAGYVARVIESARLPRMLMEPSPCFEPTDRSVLSTHTDAAQRLTTIQVERTGSDLLDRVAEMRDEALAAGSEVVHLDLPANDDQLGWSAAGVGELGFVFCALLPECASDGDVLRLQYLRDADVDPEGWKVESPASMAMVHSVLEDLQAWHDSLVASRKARIDSWRRRVLPATPTT